jgi:predicted RNase H-like HicB family nuclease
MTYTVVARRSNDGWWALSCAEIRGAHSQVRQLDDAEDMARDAIAGVLGVNAGHVDVVLEV